MIALFYERACSVLVALARPSPTRVSDMPVLGDTELEGTGKV